jgi:parallel beta-helix repeat protein
MTIIKKRGFNMKKLVLSLSILCKTLLVIMILVLFAALVSAATCPAGMSGNNTELSPCLVTNCTQLQNISLNLSAHFALNNNVDCSDTVNWNSGQGFYPLGKDPYSDVAFTGTFDGQGYNITNLFINRTGTDYAALFGGTNMSKIENVGLIDVNITGDRFGGLLGAALNTNITNCFVTGYLEASGTFAAWSGGVNGWIEYGNIVNCHFIGTIEGNNKHRIGGITSNILDGEIIDSYFIGNISGGDWISGLVSTAGWSGTPYFVNIVNSYVIGNVQGGASSGYVAGLVGESDLDNTMSITDSYFIGNVTCAKGNTGGLVGWSWSDLYIDNSYVIGNISGSGNYAGGLVGISWYNISLINNSYVIGSVIGKYVGGLMSGTDKLQIENSYFRGNLSSTTDYTGGLVGWYGYSPSTPGGNITNCYAIADINGVGYIGGIAGYNFQGNIINSYAVGNFSGSGNYIGGLVGDNIQGTITNSFSAAIIKGTSNLGGMAGSNSGTISNGYWYNVIGDDADNCYQGGNTGCTATDNKYYFYDINSQPMNSWSYNPPWDNLCDDNGYPPLESEGLSSVSECKTYSFPLGCGDIITSDTTLTYDLTNCSGNGLNIAAAGVTLDCNGHTISGSGSSTGVNVSNSDSAVVHNCTITNFNNGIGLDLSDNVDLTYNNITGGATGIFVFQSATATIQNNDISRTSTNGITLSETGNNIIVNNNIHDNSYVGISMLSTSGSNNITLNNVTGCQYGIQVGTTTSKIYNNNIYGHSTRSVNAFGFTVNLSYNQEGNYWGHASCPVFTAGGDSDNANAIDYYPYNTSDGWLTGSPTICDTTGPSVTIENPLSGAKVPRITNYIISGSVTDETLVSTVTVTMLPVFSGPATYNSSDDTWRFVADMTAAIDGYYNITVNATDLYGNNGSAEAINVEVDGTPPTISNVASSASSSGATITWTTDESSNSRVDYGTNASSLGSTGSNAAYTTSNSVSLSGLSASTLYYYNVTSCDQAGNCQSDGIYNFTTSAAPVTPPSPPTGRRTGGGITVNKNNIGNIPKTVVMRGVDKAIFTIKNRIHYAQIKRIFSNYITITVRSPYGIDVDLFIGKTAKVDVDEDGIFDIAMTLEEIYSSSAKITFQVIEELVPEEILAKESPEEQRVIIEEKEELEPEPEVKAPEIKPEPTPEIKPETSMIGKIIYTILIIFVVVIIVAIVYFNIIKKRK